MDGWSTLAEKVDVQGDVQRKDRDAQFRNMAHLPRNTLHPQIFLLSKDMKSGYRLSHEVQDIELESL